MSELRAVDKVKDKRNQFSAHSTQERRDARKGLRRLAKVRSNWNMCIGLMGNDNK
jgi:hypothetical protein